MQALIADHYDARHICTNCANGAAGIVFAMPSFSLFIFLRLAQCNHLLQQTFLVTLQAILLSGNSVA